MSEVAEENSIAEETSTAEEDSTPAEAGQDQEGVDSSPSKKETFQWNTPADEFAEDVGSDIDEESEDENAG